MLLLLVLVLVVVLKHFFFCFLPILFHPYQFQVVGVKGNKRGGGGGLMVKNTQGTMFPKGQVHQRPNINPPNMFPIALVGSIGAMSVEELASSVKLMLG